MLSRSHIDEIRLFMHSAARYMCENERRETTIENNATMRGFATQDSIYLESSRVQKRVYEEISSRCCILILQENKSRRIRNEHQIPFTKSIRFNVS